MPIFRHHYFAHVEKDKEFQTRNINIFIIFRYSQVIHKLMEYTNDHSPDPPIIPHFSINFHNSSYSKLSLDKFNWRHSIFALSQNDQTLDPPPNPSHLALTRLVLVTPFPLSWILTTFYQPLTHSLQKQ